DICGFFQDAEYEMCARWMQLGAFYPFSRNHNTIGTRRQDPVSWDAAFVNISRSVMETRYTLLPYLYTLMFKAHTEGSTVVRPLLHEFVSDQVTWDIDDQFLLGPAFLVSPVLQANARNVTAYFPEARWYDYYTGANTNARGVWKDLAAPLNHINLHVRGGYILPFRQNPLGLIIALDENNEASGELFWDDGESIGESVMRMCCLLRLCVMAPYSYWSCICGRKIPGTVTSPGLCPAKEFFLCFPLLQVAIITEISLVLGEEYTVEWNTIIRDEEKIDCYPDEHGASEANCIARGCAWEVTSLSEFDTVIEALIVKYDEFRSKCKMMLFFDVSLKSTYHDLKRIWDSQLLGFTFNDMFIRISTRLPSKYIYGFGENEHTAFKRDLNWHTWGMFSRDEPPGVSKEPCGYVLGDVIIDVTFQPTPALTYRTTGGILDFYVFLGPTPELVTQQYTEVGGESVSPLGARLSAPAATVSLCPPQDVQYSDIDYMERQLDFTLSPKFAGFPALINRMRADGMRVILILDPAISGNETQPYPAFTRGVEDDVFIKYPNGGGIVWGKVWPDYPDIVVNSSLDWDSQVEVKGPFWILSEVWLSGRIAISTILDLSCQAYGQCKGKTPQKGVLVSVFVCITLHAVLFYRQDPVSWDAAFVNISRSVMETRYTLLPYLYTLMFKAHTEGSTVVRPLLHEFVSDRVTWDIDDQFLLGPAFLVSPVLQANARSVTAYFPGARWYDYYSGVDINARGMWKDLAAPLDHINLHVRGGYILPWQEPALNTHLSRQKFMGFKVALDDEGSAEGWLFWDDGQNTIENGLYYLAHFSASQNTMQSHVIFNNYVVATNPLKLGYIEIWGVGSVSVSSVSITLRNGNEIPPFTYNSTTQVLKIDVTSKSISLHDFLSLTWKSSP
uniref:P-type domain-containing protein n=1 Tax=Ictidomys tridecemlineatus TaxID=43179 RepID=A0A287DB05_ICTTR